MLLLCAPDLSGSAGSHRNHSLVPLPTFHPSRVGCWGYLTPYAGVLGASTGEGGLLCELRMANPTRWRPAPHMTFTSGQLQAGPAGCALQCSKL